jgi:hypothetical protein
MRHALNAAFLLCLAASACLALATLAQAAHDLLTVCQ